MSQKRDFTLDLRSYARDRCLSLRESYRAWIFIRSCDYICSEFDKDFPHRRLGCQFMKEQWYGFFGEAVFSLAKDKEMLLTTSRYGQIYDSINAFEMYLYFYESPTNVTYVVDFLRRTMNFYAAYRIGEMSSFMFLGSGDIELADALRQVFFGSSIGQSMADQVLYGWTESI